MIEYCSFYIFLCGDNLSIVFFNPLNKYFCLQIYIGLLPETLIDWIEFYAVSAIFQPCTGGARNVRTIDVEGLNPKRHLLAYFYAMSITD